MVPLPPTESDLFDPQRPFEAKASAIWEYQLRTNHVVGRFCALLGTDAPTFIPIRFFRDFELRCGQDWEPELVFKSSGTTAATSSRHLVRAAAIYRRALLAGFHQFFPPKEYAIFALLPNYLERGDSSLVYMVKAWMDNFGLPGSGFYLHNLQALRAALVEAMERGEPILLIGVTYALQDLAEQFPVTLPPEAIVMETGGMKGRRAELVRAELHAQLRAGLGVPRIYSEYGMTELLSQAYTDGGDFFRCPPWMRVTITDPYIPGKVLPPGQVGRINVTDLANLHSCAFIATDDLGRMDSSGAFEVLGRLDYAEMRGCNLMYGL